MNIPNRDYIGALSAPVLHGKRLGRSLGFPTANQEFAPDGGEISSGVYAVICQVDGQRYIGVSDVGIRPSVTQGDDHILRCETFLLDFSGDLYGKNMTVFFYQKLREETEFSSLDMLREAIEKNVSQAKAYFGRPARREK